MRRENQIAGSGLNDQIADGNRREVVGFELGPTLPFVNANPKAEFGADEKDRWGHGIFADDVGVTAEALGRSGDSLPGFPIIRSAINPWIHIAKGVAVERRVGRCRIESARFDARHPGVCWKSWNIFHDIGPGFAAVSGQLEVAVIGADPQHSPVFWGFADRKDGGVHFGGGVVHRNAARLLLLLLFGIIGGEIGRDPVPGVAAIL